MEKSKNFLKLAEKDIGDVFWIGVLFTPLEDNRVEVKNNEFDVTSNIQKHFNNTKLNTNFL